MLTEGARQVSVALAEEFYKEHDVENEYEARVLSALQKRSLYEHEVQQVLGLASHGFNTTSSILACLEAKGRIHRVEKFKYALCEENAKSVGGQLD